ncbi:MAG: hypothetical protein E7641_03680 [Ruminococcaceae bacterium]|nr:hypothetical protein [Oscillospiraceae bacterium]
MGLIKTVIKRHTKSKNPNSKRYRRDMAEQICGQHIKYVTERIGDVETVIGRNGGLNIRNDEFIVYASADIIFRCPVDDLVASELLSKDGVVLSGPDLEHGGVHRSIIAFYVYYRK